MSLDMLLLDSKATIMQVNVSRLATYGPFLPAGSMYSFTVTLPLLLTEPSSPIPKECFRFRNHSEMLGLANTNTQLPCIPPIICSSI
ncbi:hypothetical protein HID58_028821 [Brassica napus]|uniref:Uncharacterized protein n=1 Tax=Brassica napus TaxID=3708 RepID=A0ABQ8CBA7_BRANA|nr:hypothetical protein HID58_028821 [Brassica napus]